MLVSEVDLDLAGTIAPDTLTPEVLKRIRQGLQEPRASEQIAAAVELRRRIASSFDADRLRPFVIHMRERYRVAVERTSSGAGRNLQSVDTADRNALLGEAESLLERLKTIYTLSSMRDAQVDSFRKGSLMILTGLLLVLLLTKLLPPLFPATWSDLANQALNMCTIALFGAVGSMVSIMRRSQKALDLGPIDIDPVRQISALRHGFSGMLIAALVGPVLALVLFAVFAGKMLIIPGLTPDITKTCRDVCSFTFLDQGYDFETVHDAAKMAIWAFLAGFAEQLVPDVLDKFTKAAKDAPAGQPGPTP